MCDVIIIGGGASGIVSSIFAKKQNNKVIVLERNNDVLKKLLMTGNGRCNYLNEVYSVNNYHSNNIDIVDEIISSDNIENVKDFFDSIGIIPKNKNGYFYPSTNQAITIKDALFDKAMQEGVDIRCNSLVTNIDKINNKFVVTCNGEKLTSDKLIISTGSCAYPSTGSDGMGYNFLKKFDHSIIKPLPALVPLISNFKYLNDWAGVRSEVVLELFEDGKYISSEMGEVQLTNYGISGICTFNLSHFVTRGLELGKKEVIKINFVPFIETLITPWIDSYAKKNPKKNLDKLLCGFINKKLVSIILKVSNLDKNRYYKDLSNEEKLILCKNLKGLDIEIIDTKSFDNAQVVNGGVSLLEINFKTMESLKVSNLYIIGELLDINGNCGGYNLTTCWISGMLAGKDVYDKN
ncbi:MAG: aminoacetone oxidase family FAD-binding enzyme [Bacilli bacterium]|nr:aminoacetone oxidase family FAD-binding enzyme [Bacilli bacterium]